MKSSFVLALDPVIKLMGWLIDPKNRQVEIYRSQRPTETLDYPEFLSGEDVLPGFVLNMQSVFQSL